MLIANDEYCGSLSTSYLRSILDCAYAFGGTAGILWGYLSDRTGRRKVAIFGLWGMFLCCLTMGFATSLGSCAVFRFVAGMASSTVAVTTLTMIGDLSNNTKERAKNVARLPLISLCGSIGPIIQGMLPGNLKTSVIGSQVACGSLVFLTAITASIMLKEVLHNRHSWRRLIADMYRHCHSKPMDPQIPWTWIAKRPHSSPLLNLAIPSSA